MGALMKDCDVHITGLLDLLNLRFAPTEGTDEDRFGGVDEMVALQKEFDVFRKGTPFSHSVSVLNLGGLANMRAKNRWLKLLDSLGEANNAKIVDTLIANLKSKTAKPVYFTSHKYKDDPAVIVKEPSTPIFYLDKTAFITISFPMTPKK